VRGYGKGWVDEGGERKSEGVGRRKRRR